MYSYVRRLGLFVNCVSSKLSPKMSGLETSRSSFGIYTSLNTPKSKIDRSKVPVLQEEELEEKFVRGSGPGGQSVNKAMNACMLQHIPTGIVVKCHEQRSLEMNRKRAREILVSQLDDLFNGEDSVSAQKKRLLAEKSIKAKQKQRKRELMKKQWREHEKDKDSEESEECS